jgi:hypothetical protein
MPPTPKAALLPAAISGGKRPRATAPETAHRSAQARLVFECKLTQVAVANTEDYVSETDREYIEKAIAEDGERRRYVFGEIMKIWERSD